MDASRTSKALILIGFLLLTGCGGGRPGSTSPSPSPISPALPSRSDFVRTDDKPFSIAYDSTHNLVYVCNPFLHRVDVVSPTTKQIVKSIHVPGGEGLTLAPDNSTLYVAGPMQEFVAIDTASLSVVRRYIYPQYNGNYIDPFPVATSNGMVLMMGYGPSGFGFFDPTTGDINGNTQQNGCMLGPVVARSGDGTKVFVSSDLTPADISLIDVQSASCVAQREFQRGFAFAVAANPNGTQFAVAVSDQSIYILDANLNTLGTSPVGGLVAGMLYSPDGRFLYVVSDPTGYLPVISTINTQTFQLVGMAPAYRGIRAGSSAELIEIPMAVDATGMIFGAADYGLALDDSTFYRTFTSPGAYTVAFGATPAEGSANGGTQVTIDIGNPSGQPSVWFGAQPGADVSLANSTLQVTTPPATNPGPVNIKIFDPDGAAAIMPQAFSYGPSPITYGTLAAGPQGGATVDLFGNGFSADVQGAGINVQIGGQTAPVTKAQFSYNDTPYALYLQHLQVTVPSGSPGAHDVTISTATGTATIPKGFHYLQSLKDYATPDTLLDILYDQSRQQLYLSAGNHVDVFSLSTNTFLAPITPPSLGGNRNLVGMSLTPDSSKLLVANSADGSVAIINPDSPSGAVAVQIVPPGTFGNPAPTQIVPTSLNTALIQTASGWGNVYLLDLGTLQVAIDNDPGLSPDGSSISSSKDGSVAIIAKLEDDGGPIVIWNAADNAWTTHNIGGMLIDGSVSGDGNVFSAVGEGNPSWELSISFLDSQANVVGMAGLPDFLLELSPYGAISGYLSGHRLHDSGSLVYLPFPQGVDIFDVRHGDLRERIFLTEQMTNGGSLLDLTSRMVHNMAIDETGQRVFLMTNKGLTIAQLDSVPLSIGSVTPAAGPAGTQVKIRGSGFLPGATASANGTSAVVSYVDSNTLQVSLPSLPSGAVQIKITNPDGKTYSLDDAYTVQ
jgi:DNA-binding beta-propeller fold protein YncE